MGTNGECVAGFLPGTLCMLILRTLARDGPLHGYGFDRHIRQQTESALPC